MTVDTNSGRVAAMATKEASSAEPVRCSTSQGKATIEIPFPAPAVSAANRINIIGPRALFLMGIFSWEFGQI